MANVGRAYETCNKERKEDDAGGKCDPSIAKKKKVPRAPEGHRLHPTMERTQKLMGEIPEVREQCQEIRVLDDRISAVGLGLLEKKQAKVELLKERRSTEVAEWRDAVVTEGGVTQKAAAGSRRL